MTDCEKYGSGSMTQEEAEAHLEACAECRTRQERINDALKESIAAPEKDGMSLADSVMAKVTSNDTETGLSERKHRRIPYATVTAAVLILFVFSLSKTGIVNVINRTDKNVSKDTVRYVRGEEVADAPMLFAAGGAAEEEGNDESAENRVGATVNDYGSENSFTLKVSAGKGAGNNLCFAEDACAPESKEDAESTECDSEALSEEELRSAVPEKIKELDFESFVCWLNGNVPGNVAYENAAKVGYEKFGQYVMSCGNIIEDYGEESFEKWMNGTVR